MPLNNKIRPIQCHLILGLEASGDMASAAVREKGVTTGYAEHKARYGHTETLITLVQKALNAAECSFEHLTMIAAGCGPGSFTGIRVCLAAASGFVIAHKCAEAGVNGLAALCFWASGVTGEADAQYLGLVDTRRASWFVQLYDASGSAISPCAEHTSETIGAWLKSYRNQTSLFITGNLDSRAQNNLAAHGTVIPHLLDARDIALFAEQSAVDDCLRITPFLPLYVNPARLGPQKKI